MVTDDPIGRMFKRGQLRRATDQDGKTADIRLRAARMWQSIYADLPGAQLTRIMHHLPRFCMPGPHADCTRTPSIRPVWIGVRQLAVQRIGD